MLLSGTWIRLQPDLGYVGSGFSRIWRYVGSGFSRIGGTWIRLQPDLWARRRALTAGHGH